MTHQYEDKNFFMPQQVAGSPTMSSVCDNYDDGQMLFIRSVPWNALYIDSELFFFYIL